MAREAADVSGIAGRSALDLHCARCGRVARGSELDRLLWCEGCIADTKARAKRVGWWCGGVMAAGLAAWVHFVQNPSAALLGGWIGIVLAAFWLCARAATELWYGVLRVRHRPAHR